MRRDFWRAKTLVPLFPTCEAIHAAWGAQSLAIHVEVSNPCSTRQTVCRNSDRSRDNTKGKNTHVEFSIRSQAKCGQ